MKKLFIISFYVFISSCAGVQFVSPYDEYIYDGLLEYKELLNGHVKDMADLGGKKEGAHEENILKYNELEIKIESLIDRAQLQSNGRGCSLTKALADSVNTYLKDKVPTELSAANETEEANSYGCTERLLILVKNQLNEIEYIHKNLDKCEVLDESISVVTSEDNNSNNTNNEVENENIGYLIDNAIDEVLDTIKETVKNAINDKIEEEFIPKSEEAGNSEVSSQSIEVSCLRPATAQSALDISNQSINAAWVVENAKKNGEE